MLFTGLMTTLAPTTASASAKDEGNIKKQEAEKLSWKLPTIIGGPTLLVLSKEHTLRLLLSCAKFCVVVALIALNFRRLTVLTKLKYALLLFKRHF